MAHFPNLLGILAETGAMQYAVILNGFLMATDNRVAYYASVEILSTDPKQLDVMEKRIFNSEDIERLCLAERVDFRADGFKMTFEDGSTEFRAWAGSISPDREIALYDDMLDMDIRAEDFKKFPDFTKLIPALDAKGIIDVKQVQKRNTHFRGAGLTADAVNAVSNALIFKDPAKKYLCLEFFHADKTKDKVDRVSAGILVTPFSSPFKSYLQACIISPVFLNS